MSHLASTTRRRANRDSTYQIGLTIKRVYGFDIDTTQTALANSARVIQSEQADSLLCNITNKAFHNHCRDSTILPPGTKSLLGLNLKFCIETPRPYQDIDDSLMQFKRSIDLYCHLKRKGVEDDDDYNPRLYKPLKDWNPDPMDRDHEYAFDRFERSITTLRTHVKNNSFRKFNLRPIQRKAYKILANNKNIICYGSDKNLGPAVIDRDTYIKLVLKEHLLKKETYKQLSPAEAETEYDQQHDTYKQYFFDLIKTCEEAKTKFRHQAYFERSIDEDPTRRPQLYGILKVHKPKLATRPIVSACATFPEIYSRYVDECLKLLVQKVLPTYIISSDQLVAKLTKEYPGPLPAGAKLFSIDAVSFYTNIETEHGIKTLTTFLQTYVKNLPLEDRIDLPIDFVIKSLKQIMSTNVIQFGNTFWRQLAGAAMGTSCAVNYAYLYFGLLEMQHILEDFKEWLPLFVRFIDDGLGIWLTNKPGSEQAWSDFQRRINDWGRLKWTNTGHVDSLEFLDLTITINKRNRLVFKTYRKPMNLYLYLPPTSAHPPDVIKSIIFGRLRAYFLHNTERSNYIKECAYFANALIKRGWQWCDLKPIFTRANQSLVNTGKPLLLHLASLTKEEKKRHFAASNIDSNKPLVFKLDFHPRGIQRQDVRQAFINSGLNALIPDRKFIVAQRRPKNLGDRLCSSTLPDIKGNNPSDYTDSL